MLVRWTASIDFELPEIGTCRKLSAVVRHDDPVRLRRLLRCRWVRATHMGGVDRPLGTGCFGEPLNRAVRLRRHVSFRRYDEDGLVVATEMAHSGDVRCRPAWRPRGASMRER